MFLDSFKDFKTHQHNKWHSPQMSKGLHLHPLLLCLEYSVLLGFKDDPSVVEVTGLWCWWLITTVVLILPHHS